MRRAPLLLCLIACGGRDLHAVETCSPVAQALYNRTMCEAACADGPAREPGNCFVDANFTCNDIEVIDGVRGCCAIGNTMNTSDVVEFHVCASQ